ncbi:MAG: HupE/UreJ family protein [Gemmatimonadota bacterium]|nr:HupE/UreJ family protein [Gemmatimonadota bacterium]
MRTTRAWLTPVATGLLLLMPVSLLAHEGHAGDHGWLAGATQPLLSLDHFLAGLVVATVVSIGVAFMARRRHRFEARVEP